MDIAKLGRAIRAAHRTENSMLVALVVQDLCGGELMKGHSSGGELIYWNRLGFGEVDLSTPLEGSPPSRRDISRFYRKHGLLTSSSNEKYVSFKNRVLAQLEEESLDYEPWDTALESHPGTEEAKEAARNFLKSIRLADIFEDGVAVTSEDHDKVDITIAWNGNGELEFGMTIIRKGD